MLSNWDHKLTVPCGQEAGQCDYSDLIDVYEDERKQPVYYDPDVQMVIKHANIVCFCDLIVYTCIPCPQFPKSLHDA